MVMTLKAPKPKETRRITVSDLSKGKSVEGQYPRPLDIIKIDGRWAQIIHIGEGPNHRSRIRYLDDMSSSEVYLSLYALKKIYNVGVNLAVEAGLEFTRTELKNIYWGSEEAKHPELKLIVTVFGEYETKKPED